MRASEIILALGGGDMLDAQAKAEKMNQMQYMRRAAALSQVCCPAAPRKGCRIDSPVV